MILLLPLVALSGCSALQSLPRKGSGSEFSLLPTAADPNPLCYECPDEQYADFVLGADPLVALHTKVAGICADAGYPHYLSNDPVFQSAALYAGRRASPAATAGAKYTTIAMGGGSSCAGPMQEPLMYNVDDYTAQSVGLPGDPPANETLAAAICCDPAYVGYAEPRGLFEQPDVALFRKVDSKGVTTFYDSVCGLPLFQAPVGRSFDDWEAEVRDNGWPSFRTAEKFAENLYYGPDGKTVFSACGTKLGTNEPDETGDRFCIDLSCISGTPLGA
jgi:peptide methionine sulfoxide reductase MsrB